MSHNDLYNFEKERTLDAFVRNGNKKLLRAFHDAFVDCIENAYQVTGWNYSFETERDDKVYEMISEIVIDSLSWEWH